MLDTFNARLAQTRDGGLGHLEFLQVLCEDEISRREHGALDRRVRRARFEQQATFEDFDSRRQPETARRDAPRPRRPTLARRRRVSDPLQTRWSRQNPCGTGTRHVARRGADVRFVKCARMLAVLAGGHADRTIGQRMREHTRPAVLIIDDFAMREHTTTGSDD